MAGYGDIPSDTYFIGASSPVENCWLPAISVVC